MADPPAASPLTRYLLENPWPAVIVLGLAAVILVVIGLREGLARHLRIGLALAALAAAVFTIASLVTTAGEHGEALARDFVMRVATRDVTGASRLLRDDAMITVGSPENPGFGYDAIITALDRSMTEDLTDTSITRLRGYGTGDGRATVDLGVVTGHAYGTVPSSWIIEARRDDDGTWRIERIVWIRLANQAPQVPWIR